MHLPQHKNGRVLKACPHCNAPNSEQAAACYVCDAPLQTLTGSSPVRPDYSRNWTKETSGTTDEHQAPPAALASAEAGLGGAVAQTAQATGPDVVLPSSEPAWRREVAHKLEAYRERRRRMSPADSQNALPFTAGEPVSPEPSRAPASSEEADLRAVLRLHSRLRKTERVEIDVIQPALDFLAAQDEHPHPESPLVPVAELRERCQAGLLDAAFVLLAYAGFLLLFRSLGGQFSFGKLDAAVYVVTFFIFYTQYFALFTSFNGTTPGMLLRRLRVVSFEGTAPAAAQLLWRSFGYLLSGGTLLLGFLWSLWDEDHLTWQDRISQTYLTQSFQQPASPLL